MLSAVIQSGRGKVALEIAGVAGQVSAAKWQLSAQPPEQSPGQSQSCAQSWWCTLVFACPAARCCAGATCWANTSAGCRPPPCACAAAGVAQKATPTNINMAKSQRTPRFPEVTVCRFTDCPRGPQAVEASQSRRARQPAPQKRSYMRRLERDLLPITALVPSKTGKAASSRNAKSLAPSSTNMPTNPTSVDTASSSAKA